MTVSELLGDFKKHPDPQTQQLIEAIADHAYARGRIDQSQEMTSLAEAMDQRIARLLEPAYLENSPAGNAH